MTKYKYSRYLKPDFVKMTIRMPKHLYEKAGKACLETRKSLNKKLVEMMEKEFGEVETVVTEG
jgi:hypothetical protein